MIKGKISYLEYNAWKEKKAIRTRRILREGSLFFIFLGMVLTLGDVRLTGAVVGGGGFFSWIGMIGLVSFLVGGMTMLIGKTVENMVSEGHNAYNYELLKEELRNEEQESLIKARRKNAQDLPDSDYLELYHASTHSNRKRARERIIRLRIEGPRAFNSTGENRNFYVTSDKSLAERISDNSREQLIIYRVPKSKVREILGEPRPYAGQYGEGTEYKIEGPDKMRELHRYVVPKG